MWSTTCRNVVGICRRFKACVCEGFSRHLCRFDPQVARHCTRGASSVANWGRFGIVRRGEARHGTPGPPRPQFSLCLQNSVLVVFPERPEVSGRGVRTLMEVGHWTFRGATTGCERRRSTADSRSDRRPESTISLHRRAVERALIWQLVRQSFSAVLLLCFCVGSLCVCVCVSRLASSGQGTSPWPTGRRVLSLPRCLHRPLPGTVGRDLRCSMRHCSPGAQHVCSSSVDHRL